MMVSSRRYLVEIPLPRALIRGPPKGPLFRYTDSVGIVRHIRRKRAAGDDLWRSCQMGGDCPTDIRNKYTNNTVADNILKWGSAGVFLGGLGIGTGSGGGGTAVESAPAVPAWSRPAPPHETVPWARPAVTEGGSLIPHERPFHLPGADIPVRVDVPTEAPTPVRPVETITPGNTFVNPAFDGDVVSVSASDSVVIGDPVPLMPETGVLEFPGTPPVTRGDTFIFEHELGGNVTPDRLPYFPTLRNPPPETPFETFELQTFSSGQGAEGGIVEDSFIDEGFLTSTPDPSVQQIRGPSRLAPRVSEITIQNPTYDPDVEELFQEAVRDWLGSSGDDLTWGPVQFGHSSGRVAVSRVARVPGMSLRSGRQLPVPVRIIAEVSSIHPDAPLGIELRSMLPLGSADAVVNGTGVAETSFGGDVTVPWDGAPLSVTDVVLPDFGPVSEASVTVPEGGFEEIPLGDPFPDMEIEEDEEPYVHSTWDIGTPAWRVTGNPITLAGPRGNVRPNPSTYVPGGGHPSTPYPPGVVVGYTESVDPSLYWWFLRRRRRRRGLASLLYR